MCCCVCCGTLLAVGAGESDGETVAGLAGACVGCVMCAISVWWIVDCVFFGVNDVEDGNGVGLAPW